MEVFPVFGGGESFSATDAGRHSLVHAAPADQRRRDVAIISSRSRADCRAMRSRRVRYSSVPVQSASLLEAIAASSPSRSRDAVTSFALINVWVVRTPIRQRQDIPDRDANELKAATPGAAPRKAFETFMAAI